VTTGPSTRQAGATCRPPLGKIEPHWLYRDDELISVRAALNDDRDEAIGPPNVFLSYRRADSGGQAQRLYGQLAEHFGSEQVFTDVDALGPGDFVERKAFEVADALVVVIGDRWASATDETGRRLLDDPRDFVRLEIERALQQGISIIPLLVGGARMPPADELPPTLARLAALQPLEIRDSEWNQGAEQLTAALARLGERSSG
jgi:hypothetical protein